MRYVSPYRRPRSNVSPDQSSRSYSQQRSNVSPNMSTSSLSWDDSVVSEPFSSDLEGSLSPWQIRQNELNLEQTNANTGQEIDFVNVRDNVRYSVNCCTYREDVTREVDGTWPAVDREAVAGSGPWSVTGDGPWSVRESCTNPDKDSRTWDMDHEDVNKDLSLSFIRTLQNREFQNRHPKQLHSTSLIIIVFCNFYLANGLHTAG